MQGDTAGDLQFFLTADILGERWFEPNQFIRTKGESLSMKKLNQFLNILLSILLGIFIGNCIFTVMDHQMNPAAYAAQSAPWYTGLLTQGLFVLAAVVIFMTVKILLAKKGKAQKKQDPHT